MNLDPAHTVPRAPIATVGGVVALLGRVLAAALVLAAGVAGWYGVERFDLGQSATAADPSAAPIATLPNLGDGLPATHLDQPDPWRQFTLTSTNAGRTERYWFDLDKWELRTEVVTDAGTDAMEIAADRAFTLSAGTSEWVEHDSETTRNLARFVLGGVGPFVLTDLIQPGALGFTALELEGTSRGDRVYEVVIDAQTLQQRHPLAYDRWVARTRLVPNGAGIYRIRVLRDGYVVRIDHGKRLGGVGRSHRRCAVLLTTRNRHRTCQQSTVGARSGSRSTVADDTGLTSPASATPDQASPDRRGIGTLGCRGTADWDVRFGVRWTDRRRVRHRSAARRRSRLHR